MADNANTVFRDFVTDGVPASGKNKVKKAAARQLLTGYETILNAFTSNGGLIYTTKASMDADLGHAEKSSAWVIGDPVAANNGIFQKQLGSGVGSWLRVADLPYSFIIASDVGAGTANAINATTSIPVTSSALVWLNVFEANTGSPVTVSFNGGPALTIKTSTGNDVATGGLVSGMILMGVVFGATFRLVIDQASAAIVAAAEAAAAIALAAANNNLVFATKATAIAATIPSTIHSIFVKSNAAVGDGEGVEYIDINNGSAETLVSSGATSRTWYLAADVATERLTAGVAKAVQMPSVRNIFSKRLQKNLGLSGGSYASIIATFGHTFLVPQGMFIHQSEKKIYCVYGADSPSTTAYTFIWTYNDWDDPSDWTYLQAIRTAQPTSFCESIWVERDGGSLFLYLAAQANNIKKFDITTLPADMGLVAPVATPISDHSYTQFAKGRDEWLVQQSSTTLGLQVRRGHFARYNSDMSARTGTVQFNVEDVGPWVSSVYQDYFPKLQGIAVGDGYYALQLGGKHNNGDAVIPYGLQGIKIANMDGGIQIEGAVDPEGMMDILAANGTATPTTIEGEGICIAEDGEIYTLSYYLSSTPSGAPANLTEGLIILKEFSKDEDAIDFSSAAATFPGFDRAKFSLGHFPRSPGGAFDPITGAQFTTLEHFCNFMVGLDVPSVEFYSTTFSILDTSGVAIPGSNYVTIQNANNSTFPVTYFNVPTRSLQLGTITGTAGARVLALNTKEGYDTIPDTNSTLIVGEDTKVQGFATLNADRTITLSKAGATDGSRFELRRFGGAFNALILNGVAGPNIATMSANEYGVFVYQTTSGNWVNLNNV